MATSHRVCVFRALLLSSCCLLFCDGFRRSLENILDLANLKDFDSGAPMREEYSDAVSSVGSAGMQRQQTIAVAQLPHEVATNMSKVQQPTSMANLLAAGLADVYQESEPIPRKLVGSPSNGAPANESVESRRPVEAAWAKSTLSRVSSFVEDQMFRTRTAYSKPLVTLGWTAVVFCIVAQVALFIAFALCWPVRVEDTTPSEVREPFPSPHTQQKQVLVPLDLKVKSYQRGRGSLLLAAGGCKLISGPPGEERSTWSTDEGSESEFSVVSDEEETRNENKELSLPKKVFMSIPADLAQDSLTGTAK